MGTAYAIHALASTPLFASRGFLAAFLIALFARFGADLPLVELLPGSAVLDGAPGWLVASPTLVVLGLLAAVEVLSDKWTEARELLRWVDTYAKPAVYLLVMLGFVGGESAGVIEEITRSSAAGWGGLAAGSVGVALFGAGLVWWMARARAAVRGALFEGDPDDEAGVQGALSWLEDIAVAYGVFFVIVFPAIAFGLALLTLAGMAVLRLILLHRERRRRRDCPVCGRKNHPSALRCAGCGEEFQSPAPLGLLGTVNVDGRPPSVPGWHRLELMRWKRCPSCAESLPKREVSQQCPVCSERVFPSAADAEHYFAHVRAKLPRTLLVCLLWSAIPVVGLVAGVVYFRLSFIPGMKRYLPATTALAGQWAVRFASLLLLWFQPIPLAGAVSVPLMCLLNYAFYSRLFLRRVRRAKFPAWSPGVAPRGATTAG